MKVLSWDSPELVKILRSGGIVVAPTDTVYGLLVNATDALAAKKMLKLKGRASRPGTVVANSIEQIIGLGIEPERVAPFAKYWPAPLSIVLPVPPLLSYITAFDATFPVRIPDHKGLRYLLQATGPLMTSSANLTGQPVVATIKEAYAIFGDLIDAYVDGETIKDAPPSTIARYANGKIEVLRQGAYPAEKLI